MDSMYIPLSGFVLKTNGFYNYSDNNYAIDVRIPDPETGTYGEEQEVERFHDAYKSRMIKVETGFRGLSFADEIMVGLSLADNYDEVQRGISMDRVFGRVHTSSNTKLYFFNSRVIGVDWDGERSEYTSNIFKPGYGVATTCHPFQSFQVKASYEKTYRFPDGYEVFGDGLLLLFNPQLSPENSNNFNLGIQFDRLLGNHRLIRS